ncbi:MAG: hypothetical protein COU81_02485 [Candidatus Portnoybacteria bacterium CG10_big_fil_rev_8_21_14_0_10_36_7]|uniref:Uncharacterized protein n=1 Tax=Candidatus Portnoybacteria bacterium CG10_big_fil_rev_8_21_14_0_10_36_7 TaxID=1974812 RepID=A0A2M8KDW3_9BACT|nr:MAG: hypothetical protein COU81_02485 [Candidatus Portnoybacteria bacterium CG10_big_fil_rev_8_21_14_0_10_36_7]
MNTNYQASLNRHRKTAGILSLNVAIIVLLIVASVASVTISSGSVAQEYKMRDMQKILRQLEEQNKNLNNEMVKIKSSQSLDTSSIKDTLAPVQKINYLRGPVDSVAQK